MNNKIESKYFMCSNFILDCKKEFKVEQLRVFYKVLYEYTINERFRNENYTEDEIHIHKDMFRKLLKQSKLTFDNEIDLILNMPNKVIRISKDGNKLGFMSVYDYIDYDYEEEEYIIKFSSQIIPFLKVNSEFAEFRIDDMLKLKSKYSVRMFEMCCKYRNQKYRTMNIEVFRKIFDVPKNYRMSEIDKYILSKSIAEINEKTNFNINVKKDKKGNVVTHITLCISEKRKKVIEKKEEQEEYTPW